MISTLLFVFGSLTILKIVFEGVHILKSCISQQITGNRAWALVTGGSEGIGLGIAEYLASRNFNLILVSRNPSKLLSAKSHLSTYPTEVVCFPYDLSLSSPSEFLKFKQSLPTQEISLIVNNAGISFTNLFTQHSAEQVISMLSLNIWPVVFLTKLFPNAKIVNISSTASINPTPGLSVYSATKAFIHCFTCVLASERSNVLSHQCAYVETEMTKRIKFKPLVILPQNVGKDLFRGLGKVSYTFGHWKHQILGSLLKVLPAAFTSNSLFKKIKTRPLT